MSFPNAGNLPIGASTSLPLISLMDFLAQPNVDTTMAALFPKEFEYIVMAKNLGYWKGTTAEVNIHREKAPFNPIEYVTTSTTQADVYGADYIVLGANSLTPDSEVSFNGTVFAAASLTNVRVGDILNFGGSSFNNQWRVTSIQIGTPAAGKARINLAKINTGQPALSTVIPFVGTTYGGNPFSIQSNVVTEGGSIANTAITPYIYGVDCKFQTVSEFHQTTDQAINLKTWDFKNPDTGNLVQYAFILGIEECEKRFVSKAMGALLLGSPSDGSGNSYQTTSGLFYQIAQKGTTMTRGNQITMDFINSLVKLRRQKMLSANADIWNGIDTTAQWANFQSDNFAAGGIVYDKNDIQLGIRQLTMSGANFKLIDSTAMSGAVNTSNDFLQMNNRMIVCPSEMMEVYDEQNRVSGKQNPITFMYREYNGLDTGSSLIQNNNWFQRIRTGGMQPIATSQTLTADIGYHARVACKIVTVSNFIDVIQTS